MKRCVARLLYCILDVLTSHRTSHLACDRLRSDKHGNFIPNAHILTRYRRFILVFIIRISNHCHFSLDPGCLRKIKCSTEIQIRKSKLFCEGGDHAISKLLRDNVKNSSLDSGYSLATKIYFARKCSGRH